MKALSNLTSDTQVFTGPVDWEGRSLPETSPGSPQVGRGRTAENQGGSHPPVQLAVKSWPGALGRPGPRSPITSAYEGLR